MKEHDKAEWIGETLLTMLAYYEWPTPHEESFTMTKCDPQSLECHYWIASDGQCYGLRCSVGQSCIAIVERMVQSAGSKQTYVTFANKNRASWKTWVKKWSKRTSQAVPDYWDASVRTTVNA